MSERIETIQDTTYRLRILHVSDLHERVVLEGMPDSRKVQSDLQQAQRYRVLGRAFDKLRALGSVQPIDLVCFTGDVADWGLPQEYAAATLHVNQLLEAAGVPLERFFVVPGNHDVQRGEAKPAWTALRELAHHNAGGLSDYMGGGKAYGADPAWRDAIAARTAAFWNWVTVHLGRAALHPAQSPHKRLGYRIELPRFPFPIHVIGLDSAWLAGDDGDAKKLHLTQGQVDRLTLDNGRPLPGFRLALVHHPLDDMADGASCRRLLADSVDLLLHGHQHDPIAEEREDRDRALRVVAAGSLFEGDHGDRWLNSFHVIDARLDSTGKPLRYDIAFWGWSPSGHWHPAGSIYQAAADGRLRWWTPHGRQALRSGDWPARLAALLATARDTDELHTWVKYNLRSIANERSIAAAGNREQLAKAIAAQIRQRGLATAAMFDRLADLESAQAYEVEWIRAMWEAAAEQTPATTPRVELPHKAGPKAPAPVSDSPSESREEASHTSIVLDRLLQWDTLVKRCAERRREHTAFLVHGSVEQDLHLFLRRITSYLNAHLSRARKPIHHVLEVERTRDGSTARTVEEWQRRLVTVTQNRRGEIAPALLEEAAGSAILIVFLDGKGPLRGLDKASAQGLVECLRRVDDALAGLARRIKNPVRLVLPIEHWPTFAGTDPVVEQLAAALRPAKALVLAQLPELVFPPWDEVQKLYPRKAPRRGQTDPRCMPGHPPPRRGSRSGTESRAQVSAISSVTGRTFPMSRA